MTVDAPMINYEQGWVLFRWLWIFMLRICRPRDGILIIESKNNPQPKWVIARHDFWRVRKRAALHPGHNSHRWNFKIYKNAEPNSQLFVHQTGAATVAPVPSPWYVSMVWHVMMDGQMTCQWGLSGAQPLRHTRGGTAVSLNLGFRFGDVRIAQNPSFFLPTGSLIPFSSAPTLNVGIKIRSKSEPDVWGVETESCESYLVSLIGRAVLLFYVNKPSSLAAELRP